MIDFVCTGEECLNCPLPDCMREANATCGEIMFRIDGNRCSKNGAKFKAFNSSNSEVGQNRKDKKNPIRWRES